MRQILAWTIISFIALLVFVCLFGVTDILVGIGTTLLVFVLLALDPIKRKQEDMPKFQGQNRIGKYFVNK